MADGNEGDLEHLGRWLDRIWSRHFDPPAGERLTAHHATVWVGCLLLMAVLAFGWHPTAWAAYVWQWTIHFVTTAHN